jgi:hypothetical protein
MKYLEPPDQHGETLNDAIYNFYKASNFTNLI